MLILRVRQSEVALADGRLDEAYDLAIANDVARHRRGQRLITRLVSALVKRGNTHLHADRFREALADCEKAARIGGNLPDVVALRAAAVDAIRQQQRSEEHHARAIATARRQIDDGQLSVGQALLEEIDGTRVGLLRHDIDHRRRTAADAITAAKQAIARGELHLATQHFVRARSADPHHRDVADLSPRIDTALRRELETALQDGELDRADDLLHHLRLIDPNAARREQMLLDRLHEAWRQIDTRSYSEARITLAQIQPMLDDTRWLKQMIQQIEQAEHAVTQLRIGPLAWLANKATTSPPPPIRWQPQNRTPMNTLPSKLLLHADGVGTFLILRQPLVTIGPVSSSIVPDIGLVAEPTLSPVTIERIEDDYFLKPARRLLANGDKLQLSPRCQLTFVLPAAASTSAALDLTGARLPRADIRRVILMDHDLIIGPSKSSHIIAPLDQPIALHHRDNQIFAGSTPITLSDPITIGNFTFVMTAG